LPSVDEIGHAIPLAPDLLTDAAAHLAPDDPGLHRSGHRQAFLATAETLGVVLATLLGYGYCHYMTK
jgi:hypothetical protein